MSYFDDRVKIDNIIKINGVAMPETSVPCKVIFQNISDGGRLADNVDFEGSLKGVKVTIELNYAFLNKEHYDLVFNQTQKQYLEGGSFFMEITVPTYTPLGIQTYRGYFNSEHSPNCVDSTEKHELDNTYQYGGVNYDELHENVVFKFIQK